MVMFTLAEVEPPELLAQTVYVTAVVCKTEGVPLISPVLELKANPLGTEGLISQLVTLPPPTLGVLVVMSVPFSRVMFSVAKERLLGACALTVREMVAVSEPPLFVAVIV